MAGADGFCRRVQSPATLIKRRPGSFESHPDGVLIDHQPSISSSHFGILPASCDRLTRLWAISLVPTA
jgi:hypothetical protein